MIISIVALLLLPWCQELGVSCSGACCFPSLKELQLLHKVVPNVELYSISRSFLKISDLAFSSIKKSVSSTWLLSTQSKYDMGMIKYDSRMTLTGPWSIEAQ